jgi:purine-binding chemotaxis protein CheW
MRSRRQFCTFRLGELSFGVDVRSIQEVIGHREMTRVPAASPVVRGLINLRGQIVMAIDLRHRLGLAPQPAGTGSINVIMRSEDRPMSLLVDDVGDILDLAGEPMEPPPETIRGEIRGLINGIYNLPDRLLLVLDPERVADFDAATEPAA